MAFKVSLENYINLGLQLASRNASSALILSSASIKTIVSLWLAQSVDPKGHRLMNWEDLLHTVSNWFNSERRVESFCSVLMFGR